jgi:hypothetical protein
MRQLPRIFLPQPPAAPAGLSDLEAVTTTPSLLLPAERRVGRRTRRVPPHPPRRPERCGRARDPEKSRPRPKPGPTPSGARWESKNRCPTRVSGRLRLRARPDTEVYVNGNPLNLSDPTGHRPMCGEDQCAMKYEGNGQWTTVIVAGPDSAAGQAAAATAAANSNYLVVAGVTLPDTPQYEKVAQAYSAMASKQASEINSSGISDELAVLYMTCISHGTDLKNLASSLCGSQLTTSLASLWTVSLSMTVGVPALQRSEIDAGLAAGVSEDLDVWAPLAQANAMTSALDTAQNFASKKAVASARGTQTLSGWGGDPEGVTRVSPQEVMEFAEQMGFQFRQAGGMDNGIPGSYYASHAEPQMAIAEPNAPVVVNKPVCGSCQDFYQALADYTQTTQIITDPFRTFIFEPTEADPDE